MMISPGAFLISLKFSFFGLLGRGGGGGGVKRQKMAKDDEKILLQLISQEPYIT